MNTTLFSPSTATVNIDVGASSGRVQVSNQGGAQQVRVFNNGSATAWIAFGDNTVAATLAGSLPVPAGGTCGFTLIAPYASPLYAAAIAAAGTGKIYFTPGAGI